MMNDRGIRFGLRSAFFLRLLAMVSLLVGSMAAAADDVRVETVLSDLRDPSGVAIREVPGTEDYEIYVAEAGAGRIIRLRSDKPNASEDAIAGFIASTDDDDLIRLPGPHGLLFLDPNRLVIRINIGPIHRNDPACVLSERFHAVNSNRGYRQNAPRTPPQQPS